MIMYLLYHGPTDTVISLRRDRSDFSKTQEGSDEFDIIELETDSYDSETRTWAYVVAGKPKTLTLKEIREKALAFIDFDVMEDPEVIELIEQKKDDELHLRVEALKAEGGQAQVSSTVLLQEAANG